MYHVSVKPYHEVATDVKQMPIRPIIIIIIIIIIVVVLLLLIIIIIIIIIMFSCALFCRGCVISI